MDRQNGDNSVHNGKKPCPYCKKRFQRLDMHQSWCTLRPQDEKDYKNEAKGLSSSDDEDDDDGKKPCPYCKKRYQRLDMHQPRCTLRPQDEKDYKNEAKGLASSDDEDDDDGKKPCPYCHKRFKRLGMHQLWCKLNPKNEKQYKKAATGFSLVNDKDYNDRKKQCPYCHNRFERLGMHQPWCKLNPKNEKQYKKAATGFSLVNDKDYNDRKKQCPYCHNRFERLGMHLPFCTLKSQDEKHYENAATGFSSVGDKDDDDRKRFQDINLHLSMYNLNPQDEEDCEIAATELSSFDDDDDENVASQSSFREEEVSTLNENQESKLKKQTEARKCFKKFQKKVQLKQEDIHNSIKINDLMKNIMDELNVCRPLKWKKLNSESYYSDVKVSKPNEFGYLLCSTLVKCRIVQDPSLPNYCRVFVTNRKQLPLDFCELLASDDELSPSKFKEYIFKVFDLCLKEMNDRSLVKISTGSTCPDYRVKYKFGSPIPLIFDIDWISCLEVEDKPDFCMEWKTKKLTDEEKMDTKILVIPNNLATNGKDLELWQLNYSTFEKIIREKCKPDDRIVIRILKNIVADENDHNSKIGSYHITNHCLHMFEEIGQRTELQEYTLYAIDSFISRLQSRDLPYFFISFINLLQNVDKKECQKMIEKMKKYREQWTDK